MKINKILISLNNSGYTITVRQYDYRETAKLYILIDDMGYDAKQLKKSELGVINSGIWLVRPEHIRYQVHCFPIDTEKFINELKAKVKTEHLKNVEVINNMSKFIEEDSIDFKNLFK